MLKNNFHSHRLLQIIFIVIALSIILFFSVELLVDWRARSQEEEVFSQLTFAEARIEQFIPFTFTPFRALLPESCFSRVTGLYISPFGAKESDFIAASRLLYLRSLKAEYPEEPISSAACSAIATMRHLEWLDLSGAEITDPSIAYTKLPCLRRLDISNSVISKATIDWICLHPGLEVLCVSYTEITPSDFDRIHSSCPNVKIERVD